MPTSAPPVSHQGRMTPQGYRPENSGWRDWLTRTTESGALVGLDPMLIPVATLTAAGHPNASMSKLRSRLRRMHGCTGEAASDPFPGSTTRRVTFLRDEVCLP